MTEKIKWYKEVLELEPNSKVFFPLARLLAEDGQTDDAMHTLEQGLKRHPEYLEARLYFIELLHKSDRKEVCQRQIGELSRMFASYAGFWDAWAACLSQRPEDADTASILRFLAANFISGPLQLHDVIDRGLTSVIEDARKAVAVSDQVSENAASEAADSVSIEDVLPESEIEVLQSAPESELPEDMLPGVAEDGPALLAEPELPDVEQAGALLQGIETTDDDISVGEDALPEGIATMEQPGGELRESAQPGDAGLVTLVPGLDDSSIGAEDTFEVESVAAFEQSGQTEASLDEALARAAEEAPDPGSGAISTLDTDPEKEALTQDAVFDGMIDSLAEQSRELEMPAGEDLVELPENAAGAPDSGAEVQSDSALLDAPESSEVEEAFSLRTRSMAEVLAEQGDIEGAIDIYHELADAARDPIEIADINHRIATLSSRMGQPAEEFEAPAMDDRASNKDKLIGMLEALARRVEARAQN